MYRFKEYTFITEAKTAGAEMEKVIAVCSELYQKGKTTFDKDLFDKAQSDGKIVIVSSWVKYCTSCAGQMKILKQAKETGALSDINFDNIEYFSFDITNKEIADLLNVKFQTTLLIFENNKEIYRSLGETTKELIYDAIKSSI